MVATLWSACEIVPVCLSFTGWKIVRTGRLCTPSVLQEGQVFTNMSFSWIPTKTSFKFCILTSYFTFNLFSPKSILISADGQLFVRTGKSQTLSVLGRGAFLTSFTCCLWSSTQILHQLIWRQGWRTGEMKNKNVMLSSPTSRLTSYCHVPAGWGLQQTTWALGSDKTRGQGSFGPFTGGLNLKRRTDRTLDPFY